MYAGEHIQFMLYVTELTSDTVPATVQTKMYNTQNAATGQTNLPRVPYRTYHHILIYIIHTYTDTHTHHTHI